VDSEGVSYYSNSCGGFRAVVRGSTPINTEWIYDQASGVLVAILENATQFCAAGPATVEIPASCMQLWLSGSGFAECDADGGFGTLYCTANDGGGLDASDAED
jgi:hypothetical protein